jgi:biopolymer transport protein ExbB/TolQ
MFAGTVLTDMLRALASGLQTPVIAVLLILVATTIVMVGTLIGEGITERRHLKVKLPQLVDNIKKTDADGDIKEVINNSGLLKRQLHILLELVSHPELTDSMREALARRLIFEEQMHYNRITRITDLIVKLGPMLGLMGTLIPLGPGLIALGQGDTYTLSLSLLTAFDTTVTGLIVAAVSFVVSGIRKGWYENYMTATEAAAECLLEREGGFK